MKHLLFAKHCFMYLISSPHNNPEKQIDNVITILQMRKPRPERLGDFPGVTPQTSTHAPRKPVLWLRLEWALLAAVRCSSWLAYASASRVIWMLRL